jgi:L-aminopeptidase/D-esterase-like protein
MRLAANADTGLAVVLSFWFLPEGDALLAAVYEDSRIAIRLKEDPRPAAEVAPNQLPLRFLKTLSLARCSPR